MNELVSIIVPCYNQSEYMDECLQSVLEQTYKNWECIIVNDGSPDNTEDVALKWHDKDPRFIYLRKENGGLSSARNFGMLNARGKYILPLDCDDKIGAEYLKFAIEKFEENPDIGVIYCQAEFFGTKKGKWHLPPFDKKFLLCENQLFCSGIFLKKDWEEIGGYDENIKKGWEDWEFWINLLYTLDKSAFQLKYTGFYYRQKENSMIVPINKNENLRLPIYHYIYEKHKEIYSSTLGHPIFAYKRMMHLEHKNRLFILFFNKIKSIFKINFSI